MSRYYEILRLKTGDGIVFHDTSVTIDLEKATLHDIIQNDYEFNSNINPEHYFYVSGGGSFLFDGRYLLTVRRPLTARVNPGKLSIFTGRAEGLHEWREPWRIVRELFEEVVLLKGQKLLYPLFAPYQEIIDEVYRNHFNDRFLPDYDRTDINLEEFHLTKRVMKVASEGVTTEYHLFFNINTRNDINVMTLFCLDVNPNELGVFDAEELNLRRKIFLLDVKTNMVKEVGPVSCERWQSVRQNEMTDHLQAMLDDVQAKIIFSS